MKDDANNPFVREGINLRALARADRRQKILILCLASLAAILYIVLVTNSLRGMPMFVEFAFLGVVIVGALTILLIAINTVRLMWHLEHGVFSCVFVGLLLALPIANVLAVLIATYHGTRTLRNAGIPVGWLGMRDREVFQLLSQGRLCYRCGYNLTGNVSGICPECGTMIPACDRAG